MNLNLIWNSAKKATYSISQEVGALLEMIWRNSDSFLGLYRPKPGWKLGDPLWMEAFWGHKEMDKSLPKWPPTEESLLQAVCRGIGLLDCCWWWPRPSVQL